MMASSSATLDSRAATLASTALAAGLLGVAGFTFTEGVLGVGGFALVA